MSGVNEIRSTFLDYFAKNGHEVVPSSPLVPRNDPTLMFTNAGMVPFKNVFTGLEKRDYVRATSSQKCVRAGGKHNDLDNVGYTARHHTFFEMLGNFSFGDYFKENAIELAWNLITKEFGLATDKLLVTVYSEDDEAFNIWKKLTGFADERIIRIPTSDNFWAMGDTGPCGPCSEIFYDHGEHIWGGPPGSPEEDGDRFIEIWNLVFMQYEQLPDRRIDLPRPSIDTGMGLERFAAIMQGVHNNYEIDLFKALIASSEHLTGVEAEGKAQASHRVIADHLRSMAFLIADGVTPSNEGRGYVLRRIMRRAMRHANLLGANEPVIFKMLPTLVREMGQAFPELHRAEKLIEETVQLEERRFIKTLERGLGLLEDATSSLGSGDQLDGETAFKLYDTFGFPLDLTQDALRNREIAVDTDAFNVAMERQRAEARAAWSGSGDAATDAIWYSIKEKAGATEFLGYGTEKAEGVVLSLVKDGEEVTVLTQGEEGFLILNQTPFYGESGGQVGDCGIMKGDNVSIRVTNTQKKTDGLFIHAITVESGDVKVDNALELIVEHGRRSAIRSNHSATHLVHEALREVLGAHVAQKGSLVTPERLRFDFSHPKPVSSEESALVEAFANEVILQNTSVETSLMEVDEAIEAGAMALFGEKYGDEVRVVSMGTATRGEKAGKAFSVELCGGTHVRRTGDIGLVTVVSEGAVAAGVRRIEALTGGEARKYLAEQDALMRETAGLLKISATDVPARVASLLEERKKLERELAEAKKKLAMSGGGSGADTGVSDAGQFKLMARVLNGINPKDLKSIADEGKTALGSGVVVLISKAEDGKAAIVVGVTKDKTETVSAVDLVRIGSAALGGRGGGGRPDMAQAGGPDADKADDAIAEIKSHLEGL
ncbi:alanine--tRNA ligase [Pseudovibrio sp. Tun.PSC04-5.I4]|uniref:alanine--tRNA ligase n=1 Tax=Pseudovibrio sp. Tun.PSC04-5.I4 TaxID=1798213 RepID=UPI00088B9251|nr:alanine--tRNA ligase [Pseudovibrio sp. Tun.PSC04-5.I4]SDR37247.1 alanyl-tRNA synthetase [Pseudovibrio sp. Tun.PSC04-5.I4]